MINAWGRHKGKRVALDSERLNDQLALARRVYEEASAANQGVLFMLRAPTGFGKTEVLFAPFLYQFVEGQWFAPRMYLVEPVNALLKQMEERAKVYSQLVAPSPTVGSDYGDTLKKTYLYTAVITLTTVDSAFYGFTAKRVVTWRERDYETGRYSMPAGLLTGSYLVFDEAHLIQDQVFLGPRVMSKVICSIVAAGGLVVFSSATLPSITAGLFKEECDKYGAKVIDLPFPRAKKEARVSYVNRPISEAECGEGSAIFVNTVERAIKMKERCKGAVLLHSLMRKDDKERALRGLEEGKALIATQAAEVGIDYDFKRVITELAPIDSLIQRFGRVRKDVIDAEVYEVENSLPYDDDVVNRSRDVLQSVSTISSSDVGKLVDEVYDESIVGKLSELGDTFYLSTVEYLQGLTLFSYPPEDTPYLKPSYYVTLYLLSAAEYEKIRDLHEGGKADAVEEVSRIMANASVKYPISYIDDYNRKRLESFIEKGDVYNGAVYSKDFLKKVKGITHELIIVVDGQTYSPDEGFKGLIGAVGGQKGRSEKRSRKKGRGKK